MHAGQPNTICANSAFNDDITYSSGALLCTSAYGFGADCMYTAWGGIQLGVRVATPTGIYFGRDLREDHDGSGAAPVVLPSRRCPSHCRSVFLSLEVGSIYHLTYADVRDSTSDDATGGYQLGDERPLPLHTVVDRT